MSKLKIDPQIIGAQNTPQARLTLEQQINRDLTFTYIQDVTSSNPQIVRVQWDLDPKWSDIAERQENGEFGVDLFYKRSFRKLVPPLAHPSPAEFVAWIVIKIGVCFGARFPGLALFWALDMS